MTYSTVNNSWRRQWKAVGGWRGWGATTTVHVDDGNRADDDASASSPVPCSPTQWRWQWRRGPLFTLTMATGRTMMPWHHHLSLACPRDGNGSGSGGRLCVNDSNRAGNDALASSPVPRSPARWQWRWRWRWQQWCGCLCTSTAVTGRTMMPWHHHLSFACLHDGNDGGGANNVAQ